MAPELEDVLRKKWGLPLLRLLDEEDELNFSVMENELGISSSTLTQTKNLLVECGLVKRNELKRTDIRYELTPNGEKFLQKIGELEEILDGQD